MNTPDETIRAFIRILKADKTPATGIAASISAIVYTPILTIADTPTVQEFGDGIYYIDFVPTDVGAWLVEWICSNPRCYGHQVFDIDEDIIKALQRYSAQAF